MAGRVYDLDPPQPFAASHVLIHFARAMMGEVEIVRNLEVIGHDRILRQPRHLLSSAFAGDDVSLPGVAVDCGPTEPLECRQPT